MVSVSRGRIQSVSEDHLTYYELVTKAILGNDSAVMKVFYQLNLLHLMTTMIVVISIIINNASISIEHLSIMAACHLTYCEVVFQAFCTATLLL